MKAITIILVLITNMVFAQEYIPILKEGNQWNVIKINDYWGPGHLEKTWETTKLTIGDTIVENGTVFHKILNEEDSVFYLINEDVENRKVYFGEDLIYDFSFNVGDTMDYYNKWNELELTLRVDSITEYILEDGSITREFHNSCKDAGSSNYRKECENWIEGIGGYIGINSRPSQQLVGAPIWSSLLCFKNDTELLYMNTEYNTCDENYTKVEIVEEQSIFIYPNPVTSELLVKLDNIRTYNKITITDLLGIIIYSKRIKSEPEITIDVTTFKKGIYFLTVENKNPSMQNHIMKIVKE